MKLRSRAQVAPGPPLQARCARIVPALLPAAELMLRGVMDLRHKHWQERAAALLAGSVRDAVEEARRPYPDKTLLHASALPGPWRCRAQGCLNVKPYHGF